MASKTAEAPAVLSALLDRSRAVALIACGLESCLLFATAGLLCLSAAALDGQGPGQAGALGAAAMAGTFAALSWWLERRPTRLGLVRRVDRALGRIGGLVTAWECAGNGEARRQEIPRALIESELSALSTARVLRAGLPRSGPLLCAPLLAGALLASVIEAEARSLSTPTGSGSIDGARAWSSEPGIAEGAEALDAEPALAEALPGEEPARKEAGGVTAEEPEERDPESHPGSDVPGESDPVLNSSPEKSPGEGARDRALGSSPSRKTVEYEASSAAREAGLVGGRWWPRRYDDLVAGWIEARRALAESAGENPR